jgi:hypothetical protein
MIAATGSRALRGIVASTLRMKWTRQRCQVVPLSTVAIARLRPSCASETTSRTPRSPRFTKAAQKRRPEGPILRRAGIDVVFCGIDSERMRDGRSFFTRPRLGDFHHVRGHYRPRNFAVQKIRIE